MTPATADRPLRPTTARAVALVAARREAAGELGRRLAELVGDPDAFATELRAGLGRLADPDYLAGQRLVAPGIGAIHGVRWPLLSALSRGFRAATRGDRTAPLLFVVDRLFREEHLEARWLAFGLLERLIADDPERTWQLLRRAAREAADWITVDSLAHPVGKGVLLEPYRWAELDQLVYSSSRWERRLVGSTIATIPFVEGRRGRGREVARHALPLVGELIGDREPDVQKALSWALRALTLVDADATAAFCEREAAIAAATGDGHRAWVVRDALPKLDPVRAAAIRARLRDVRKRPGAPSTSRASATAAGFGSLP